ncbi:MAG: exodeoxyribonuclease I [Gammaproteobacteria bacterium]|nr:exodeoxyribonuclease I [Gammaproteobacteria bacterium]
MTGKSIYWYDFETFGSNPRRDRAAQFAGIRTDEELNILGEPLVIYCKPANDFLPSPEACLITGITPQLALEKGLDEAEFIRLIHQQFSQPETCVAGYNSIRFDDELTRQLLYRNFYDPYAREWKAGNSRWDIIDMLRLCAAARPEGINWPINEKGNISFRLEKLTAANDIAHADAHDALADVIATIEMAKLVRQQQPKLYDYVYQLRSKRVVESHLDVIHKKPVIHVSSMYPPAQGCLALVAPLCLHPDDKNGVVVYDLRENPDVWMSLSPEEISQRIFTRTDELPEHIHRIPLKTLHINRCPIVAPMAILDEEKFRKFGIDKDSCNRHWQTLCKARDLPAKIREALKSSDLPAENDPDFMIYSGGFFSEGDRKLMDVIRESTPEQLAMLNLPFRDRRLAELLFRYRARNYPETLDLDEQQRWQSYRHQRLTDSDYRSQFDTAIEQATQKACDEQQIQILRSVSQYVEDISPRERPTES